MAEKKESKKEEDIIYIFTPYITQKMGQEYMQVNMVKRHLEFQKKIDNLYARVLRFHLYIEEDI